jgi:hypothetical protein
MSNQVNKTLSKKLLSCVKLNPSGKLNIQHKEVVKYNLYKIIL